MGVSMRLLSAIVLALVTALSIISAVVAAFPVDMTYKLIWAGIAFPVLWALLIFFAYWSVRPALPVILCTILSAASIAAILAQ